MEFSMRSLTQAEGGIRPAPRVIAGDSEDRAPALEGEGLRC